VWDTYFLTLPLPSPLSIRDVLLSVECTFTEKTMSAADADRGPLHAEGGRASQGRVDVGAGRRGRVQTEDDGCQESNDAERLEGHRGAAQERHLRRLVRARGAAAAPSGRPQDPATGTDLYRGISSAVSFFRRFGSARASGRRSESYCRLRTLTLTLNQW